jgi:hypothetical protein
VLQRHEFIGVTNNAISGLGFPPEAAMVRFPVSLFLAESDLSPINEHIDQFIAGLTSWKPEVKKKGLIKPPMIQIEGRDYPAALANYNKYFTQYLWNDGLPMLPPTEERVKWILRGTDLPSDKTIGKFLPRGGVTTVETLAVALAMAGGRPEYLPVLIAAVEGIFDPGMTHQAWQATSHSVFPVVIVNGPIAKQIRLNSGFGLLGPDSLHPAGGCIGRALRLLQQNVGGAIPGVGTMAQFGAMRYTNAVFAEDEDGLPPGWEPLNVEYFGHPKGRNTASIYTVSSAVNIVRRGTGKETAEEEATGSLHRIAAFMGVPNVGALDGYKEGAPGILLLSTTVANQLAELGWTQSKIKDFLWENSKIPVSNLKKQAMLLYMEVKGIDMKKMPDPWPIASKAKNIMMAVAGGSHPTHAYWMQGAQAPKTVSKAINLPSDWEKLLREAEEDLGPLP